MEKIFTIHAYKKWHMCVHQNVLTQNCTHNETLSVLRVLFLWCYSILSPSRLVTVYLFDILLINVVFLEFNVVLVWIDTECWIQGGILSATSNNQDILGSLPRVSSGAEKEVSWWVERKVHKQFLLIVVEINYELSTCTCHLSLKALDTFW